MTPNQDERLLAQQFETIFTKYYSVVKYFALMLLKSEERKGYYPRCFH